MRSCGVSEGSTNEVTSRTRGGEKHKDKNTKRSAKKERTERRVDQVEEKVESIGMDSPPTKEDSELNETRTIQIL